jgi:acetyl-CoA synthetase
VVTCSAVKRGPKHIELKKIVDEALQILDNEEELHIPRVLVYDHKASGVSRDAIQASPVEGRDVWWQDVIGDQSTDCEVTWVGAEDPLFKLYTSGSTGKPKGVLHTTAGYMIGAAATFNYVFDYKPDDIFWCTADCGWITGHSYVTFGPLLMGAKQVLFEGVPTYPDAGRCWEVCDKYGVTLFYTAPTAIRTLMACGEQHVTKHKRTSLRILGTVGEPINPEAWRWYYEVVGNSNVSVVDTWWQTETGAHMITPLPGATPMKPGSGEGAGVQSSRAACLHIEPTAAAPLGLHLPCVPGQPVMSLHTDHSLPCFPPPSPPRSHAALLWRGARHPGRQGQRGGGARPGVSACSWAGLGGVIPC